MVPGEAEDCWGGVLATGWGLQKDQGLIKTLIPEEQPRLIKGKLLSVGSISTRGIFLPFTWNQLSLEANEGPHHTGECVKPI